MCIYTYLHLFGYVGYTPELNWLIIYSECAYQYKYNLVYNTQFLVTNPKIYAFWIWHNTPKLNWFASGCP